MGGGGGRAHCTALELRGSTWGGRGDRSQKGWKCLGITTSSRVKTLVIRTTSPAFGRIPKPGPQYLGLKACCSGPLCPETSKAPIIQQSPQGGETERDVLISWQPVVGWVGMTQRRAWEGSDLTFGNIHQPWGWSNAATYILERWVMCHACQSSGSIWTMPSMKCFNYWYSNEVVRQLELVVFVGPFSLDRSILSLPFTYGVPNHTNTTACWWDLSWDHITHCHRASLHPLHLSSRSFRNSSLVNKSVVKTS